MRRSPLLKLLCAACLLAVVASCQRSDGGPADRGATPMPGDALAWRVDRVQVTRHLATSTLESRDAAQGNQFVVLDVDVRNPDAQPQVVSEGRLVAIDAAQERTFATPVSMLADEFLTLQVLAPAASVHGRIAFEVPQDLAGALYWTPGNSTQRIRLPSASPPPAPGIATSGHASVAAAAPAATTIPPVTGERPASVPPASSRRRAMPAPAKRVANRTAPVLPRASNPPPPRAHAIVIPAAQEQERRARCGALLTRNAPADEALRPFYLLNCPDYPLPPAWRRAGGQARAPVSAAAARPASSACGATTSHAAQLVCADPILAGLDRRLAQSLSRALQVVDDPAALQRQQDDWRARVRDACGTNRCLELAYGRRTAHVDALGRRAP